MALNWNGEAAARALKEESARRLQRAMDFFWKAHTKRLDVSNPRPYENSSKPGEYPRKRSGGLIGGVVYGPETVQGIIAESLKIRAGLLPSARYGLILEFHRQRKGFLATMNDLKPQLKAILEQKV